ncbi:MAG: hypothetical protein V1918_06250, partial [Planctomycetota bacterium]
MRGSALSAVEATGLEPPGLPRFLFMLHFSSGRESSLEHILWMFKSQVNRTRKRLDSGRVARAPRSKQEVFGAKGYVTPVRAKDVYIVRRFHADRGCGFSKIHKIQSFEHAGKAHLLIIKEVTWMEP